MTTVPASTDQTAVVATADATTLCAAFRPTARAAATLRAADARRRWRSPGDSTPSRCATWRPASPRTASSAATPSRSCSPTVPKGTSSTPRRSISVRRVSIYNTSSPEQIEYVFDHAAVRLVVTERAFADRVLAARERLPALRYVFIVDGAVPGTADLEELSASGDPGFDFESAWRAVEPQDIATLIYTSGHDRAAQGRRAHARGPGRGRGRVARRHRPSPRRPADVRPADRRTSPTACARLPRDAERRDHHLRRRPQAAVAPSPALRPTLWLGVPRVYEKLKAALEAKFAAT